MSVLSGSPTASERDRVRVGADSRQPDRPDAPLTRLQAPVNRDAKRGLNSVRGSPAARYGRAFLDQIYIDANWRVHNLEPASHPIG